MGTGWKMEVHGNQLFVWSANHKPETSTGRSWPLRFMNRRHSKCPSFTHWVAHTAALPHYSRSEEKACKHHSFSCWIMCCTLAAVYNSGKEVNFPISLAILWPSVTGSRTTPQWTSGESIMIHGQAVKITNVQAKQMDQSMAKLGPLCCPCP